MGPAGSTLEFIAAEKGQCLTALVIGSHTEGVRVGLMENTRQL